jgi:hypothetical protein
MGVGSRLERLGFIGSSEAGVRIPQMGYSSLESKNRGPGRHEGYPVRSACTVAMLEAPPTML